MDDIECVLRDLYGDIDSEALENILYSVFSIAKTFTEYARTDLWIEHVHAMDLDYNFGIGVPEGYGISGREWRRGMRAKVRLYTRACEVRTNTSAFSEYTVEFARRFSEQWMLPDNDLEFLKLSDEMKMGWFTKDIPDDFEEIPF